MYLKRLEMYGFKSFAEKTVLEFIPGITTVIGPNGSGKSNISDCIRWILGEQSIKNLRGNKSEDIIFSGTQNRKALGYAEGSLIFDNSDGKLPIEYSEVTVTRKIYRSGETGYFINKTPCRLKDIVELFLDTGIGKDGYSIIGQGKIDEILSNKSEDRRHIFEEAAGIVKFRVRKNESEKKLEQTKINLLRINDIIQEIESNIESLKLASEKAKHYLNLREELKGIEVGLFLYNINDFKNKISQVEENEKVYIDQIESAETTIKECEERRNKIKEQINFLIDQIEKMQKLSFEGEKKKEQFLSDIGIYQERIANNDSNKQRYEKEIEEIDSKNQDLEDEKKNKISKKTSLKENKDKFEKELKEKEEELAKYAATLSTKALEIENKKSIVEKNIDTKFELGNQLSTEKANLENFEKLHKSIQSDLSDIISELDKANERRAELENGFIVAEKEKNTLLSKVEAMSLERNKSEELISQYDKDIINKESELRLKQTRRDFLIETEKEKEGYAKSVKLLLNEIENDKKYGHGVHGTLGDLISVNEKYQTAIEIALGGSIQNIVTDSENEAKALVKLLKDKNLGRVSFLPITTVKGNKLVTFNKAGIKGIEGIASDLIEYSKAYDGIIQSLLGRTIIVDNIDNAVELAKANKYSFRIVTLEGDVISNTGSISGGSIQKKTVNILGRKKEIDSLAAQIKNLESDIVKIQADKEKYKKSIENSIKEYEEIQEKQKLIEIRYATEKERMDNINNELDKIKKKRDLAKESLSNNEIEKQKCIDLQKEIQKQIEEIDSQSAQLNKEISEYNHENKENQEYIDNLNFDITNLKISVNSFDESETSIDEFVSRIDLDIKNNETSKANKIKQITKIDDDNKKLVEKIEKTKEQIEELHAQISTSGNDLEKLRNDKSEQSKALEDLEESIKKQRDDLEGLKNSYSRLDVKKSKLDLELNLVIGRLWDEYELTPNNTEGIEMVSEPSKVQKQVTKLREDIKELGSINIDSIKEYNDTKQRYDFLCEQRLDLEASSAKLRKIITEMTNTMKKQFSSKFKIINKNFGEVFKELFGGGKASLILDDESNVLECGIDIQVQPPGKKLQSMSLLSGGERAFTAIALLFAILKINPSPFCVLDEIEAALDDVNVYRFANYLKHYTDTTQFLVITHRKGTMECADTVYGITMEEKGISKLLSMKLK